MPPSPSHPRPKAHPARALRHDRQGTHQVRPVAPAEEQRRPTFRRRETPARDRPPLRSFVEQDRVQTLLDRLRTADYQAAALELIQHGAVAIPALVDALAWRDMEMRRRAFEVLQRVWPGVMFDPFAPELDRMHQ